MPEFGGLKITQDAPAAQKYGLHCVRLAKGRDEILTDEPGLLGWGGNSGFHALNLAVQCGARRVVLVGFDLTLDYGTHWHGRHPKGLNNPNAAALRRWRRVLDDQAPRLKALGVEVINASPISALEAYPKAGLEEALT